MDFDFEDVRPYIDSEVPAAIERIVQNELFPSIVHYIYPNCNITEFIENFKRIKTVHDFQFGFMREAVKALLNSSISDISSQGIENIQNSNRYIYLSNHRDIMLDSSILLYLLSYQNFELAEITFGSNLMSSQLVIDVGKLNKMFKFQRADGSLKNILQISQKNSAYLRYAIIQKKESIWIAQRNGRTKDGNDKTDASVLKMFAMSSNADFVPNLTELNIVPISISYEFEPCDFLKTHEVYVSRRTKYVKAPNEDLNSIIHGLTQKKGRVNVSICKPITSEVLEQYSELPKNDRFKHLASQIDDEIYRAYKLWPNNFIAHDVLNESGKYEKYYTEQQKNYFLNYAAQGLAKIEGNTNELKEIFLGIYANPVSNSVRAGVIFDKI